MSGAPFDWNVVVVGAWNPAILTPHGIARRLFGLAGAPVQVMVPVDGLAPIQVRHDGLVVVPSNSKLVVSPDEPQLSRLVEAARVASQAIESLPDTPLVAAGVNIRYRFDSVPEEIVQCLESPLDAKLSDADFHTQTTFLRRGLVFGDGILNLELLQEDATGVAVVNFHRNSGDSADLRAWLAQTSDMTSRAIHLLANTLGLMLEGDDA